jgi:hypothetical protein
MGVLAHFGIETTPTAAPILVKLAVLNGHAGVVVQVEVQPAARIGRAIVRLVKLEEGVVDVHGRASLHLSPNPRPLRGGLASIIYPKSCAQCSTCLLVKSKEAIGPPELLSSERVMGAT